MVIYVLPISAGVAELADAGDLKSPGRKAVRVQPPLRAPIKLSGCSYVIALFFGFFVSPSPRTNINAVAPATSGGDRV